MDQGQLQIVHYSGRSLGTSPVVCLLRKQSAKGAEVGASANPEWELDPRGEEAGESSKLRIPWKSSDCVPLSGIRKVGEEPWRAKAIPKPSSWEGMPCLELTETPG